MDVKNKKFMQILDGEMSLKAATFETKRKITIK
jgi:hypothetical protein